MKKIVFFLAIVCSVSIASAQQYTDSAQLRRQRYEASNKSDTARLTLYLYLSSDFRRNDYDSCLYYARQAMALSRRMKWKLGEAYALSRLEFGLRETGDLAGALNAQLQALQIARELNDKSLEADQLNSIGNTYLELGDARQGLEHYRLSRQLFIAVKNTYWIRNETSNMGNAFEKLNLLDSALLYEMEMYRDTAFPADLVPELLLRLGNLHTKLKQDSVALVLYHKGVYLSFPVQTTGDRAQLYYQIAQLHHRRNLDDSSLYYAKKSFFTAQSISLRKGMLDASLLISDIYSKMTRFDSAFQYQQVAMRYNDTLFGADKLRDIQLILLGEQQRQQKLLQENKERENQYRLLGAVGLLVLLLGVLFFVGRSNRLQKRTNHLLSLQKEQITAQRDEIQQTLAALKSTQSQLIQSEKIASLGEPTAGIAHEIQNPLNFITNFSEVSNELIDEMQEELNKGDVNEAKAIALDIKQNLEKVSFHGKRADSIVKGMLQHSRSSSGQKEPTDINALTDEYLRLSYHGLRAKDKNFNALLETYFDKNIGTINIILQGIGRVLLNLFTNAFYSVAQKKKGESEGYQPTVSVTTRKVADQIHISVKDNGAGIPQKVKDKIFQLFFTTKPTGEGTGLGLSLSYDIITEGHGGSYK